MMDIDKALHLTEPKAHTDLVIPQNITDHMEQQIKCIATVMPSYKF